MRRFIMVFVVMVGLLLPALAPAQEQKPLGSEFAKSWTSVLNLVYFPIKLSVALVGAPIGGAAGLLTGGNERAAEGIWRPTVGGTYFITPEVIEGSEPFLPVDRGVHRPQSGGEGMGGSPGY